MSNTNHTHLVLLHPPSVFDFRERPLQRWMLSKPVDTAPTFEYYPVGFISTLDFLEERGKSVRLMNLAVRMQDPRFDVRQFVREQQTQLFGIDLHWFLHADGALSLAKLCKQEHPETPVVLGGITATHFWKEIMETVPEVDFVLRGHTTEPLIYQLLDCLSSGLPPTTVPNLAWRRNGEIVENPYTYKPATLTTKINYPRLRKHMSMLNPGGWLLTGQHWPVYCFNLLLFCKGCEENCAICGGSNWAQGLDQTVLWDTEVLTDAILAARSLTRSVIRLPGDIRQGDWRGFLAALKRRKFTRAMHFDFFRPGDAEFYRAIADAVPEPHATISAITHDEKLRKLYGLPYSNAALEQSIEDFLAVGGHLSAFFYVGIPGQTRKSAEATTSYAISLLERFATRRKPSFDVYVAACPFVDPGSLAFTYPEKYGYRLRARTLAQHRELMREPEWWDTFNYESETLSRYDLAAAAIDAEIRITGARAAVGLCPSKAARQDLEKLAQERVRLEESELARVHHLAAAR